MKNNRGITLIALVVTIIILLILAGVTLNIAINDNGLIQRAKEATLMSDINTWKEKLEVAKATVTIEGQGTLEAEKYFTHIEEQGIINNKEKDILDNEDGTYDVTTKPGYIFEVELLPNEENPSDIKITYIGEEGKTKPRIKVVVIEKTTSSITVEVQTREKEDIKLSYYYKTKDEEEYHELKGKQNTKDLTAEYTGLTQKTIYNIKVVATNKYGESEKIINVLTGEVGGASDGLSTGALTASSPTWDASTHKASLTLSTTESTMQIQYQIGGIEGSWTTGEKGQDVTVSNLDHNANVYARLWDGTNAGSSAYVAIRDGQGPTVTVNQGAVTTNSIVVNVGASDNEWGMPDSISYNYFIKKTSDTSYPIEAAYTGPNASKTFEGLEQNTSYDIKVTTVDKAGNAGEKELTKIETGTVGGASEGLSTGVLTASSPTWNASTHKASVTLSTTESTMQIQYQIGGIEGSWTTGEKGQDVTVSNLDHNANVYARLWDGTNAGSSSYVAIRDGQEPENATISLGATSVDVGANVTATVTHIDNQSGPNITSCKWVYNTKPGKIGTSPSSYTDGTFSSNGERINLNASSAETYYLHVLTIDKAGNPKETISNAITVSQPVTSISLSKTSMTLYTGDTSSAIGVTINPSNATNKTISWSSSNTSIATVDSSGRVKAISAGKATITASSSNKKTATCTVTVKTLYRWKKYTVAEESGYVLTSKGPIEVEMGSYYHSNFGTTTGCVVLGSAPSFNTQENRITHISGDGKSASDVTADFLVGKYVYPQDGGYGLAGDWFDYAPFYDYVLSVSQESYRYYLGQRYKTYICSVREYSYELGTIKKAGSYIETVTSSNSNTYPNDGVLGDYYYIKIN